MYTSSDRTLNYLSSEWQRVQRYLTCPPSDPLKTIAEEDSRQDIVDAKYGYLLDEMFSVDSRDCEKFQDIPETLTLADSTSSYEPSFNVSGEPLEPQSTSYEAQPLDVEALSVKNTRTATVTYGLGSVLVALAAASCAMIAYADRKDP